MERMTRCQARHGDGAARPVDGSTAARPVDGSAATQTVGRSAATRTGIRLLLPLLFWTVAFWAVGCAREAPQPPRATAAVMDSFLVELGKLPTASLDRAQRWRMISSIWVGLPPAGYTRDSLPDPRSHGAALLQVYCVQCHWMPSPQMHSAEEWPLLVRRMLLRARTVRGRMGGPLTAEILSSERLVEGMSIARYPTDDQVDSLVAYLTSHALPVVEPGELPEGPEAALFVGWCSICHETPSPRAHTAAGWEPVVGRMIRNMSVMGVEPPTGEETRSILAFLRRGAAR